MAGPSAFTAYLVICFLACARGKICICIHKFKKTKLVRHHKSRPNRRCGLWTIFCLCFCVLCWCCRYCCCHYYCWAHTLCMHRSEYDRSTTAEEEGAEKKREIKMCNKPEWIYITSANIQKYCKNTREHWRARRMRDLRIRDEKIWKMERMKNMETGMRCVTRASRTANEWKIKEKYFVYKMEIEIMSAAQPVSRSHTLRQINEQTGTDTYTSHTGRVKERKSNLTWDRKSIVSTFALRIYFVVGFFLLLSYFFGAITFVF